MEFNKWSSSGVTSPVNLTPRSTSEVPLTLTGLASMTANMFEVKNSTGTVVFSVDVDGDVYYLGDETIADSLTVTGNIVGHGNLTIDGTTTLGAANITTLAVSGNSTFTGTGRFTGDLTANHNLNVNNSLNVNGYSYINAVQYFSEQASAPSAIAQKGVLYTKDAATITELFYKDSAGSEVQLTSGGSISMFLADNTYLGMGNTAAVPDAQLGWTSATSHVDLIVPATGTFNIDGSTTRTGTAELLDVDATINTTTLTDNVIVSSITVARNSGDSGATDGLVVTVTTGDMADTVFSRGISSTVVATACTHNTSDAAAFEAGAVTGDANVRDIAYVAQAGYDLGLWLKDSALQMGSSHLANDCGTFTMIKGAQTSDPQVQFALSADANGDFSITADTGDITLSAADDIYLTATGGQIYAGAAAIQMGDATADCSTLTMIKGTVGSDPQTQLAIDGSGNFSVTTTVGDITLTAADDFFVSVDGNIELALNGTALYPQTDGGLTLGVSNTNEWGGLYMNASSAISWDNGDVTLTHSAGALTLAGGSFTYTVAAAEYAYLNATGAAHTDTNGVLKVAVTSETNNVIGINLTSANTATAGNTAYNLYSSMTSSAVMTSGAQALYGTYTTVTKSGADNNAASTALYGVYSIVSNTGSTDVGTKNNYAGYFTVVGDTAGTSTNYAVYATAASADTNYAFYAAAGTSKFLGQAVFEWSENTTDAVTITTTALTTGSALVITGPSGATAGVTDALVKITTDIGNCTDTTPTFGVISSTATIDTAGASDTGVNLFLSTANTNATNANSSYGIYNAMTDAIVLANTNYGIYTSVTNTGAIDTAITKTVYGGYTSAVGTGGAPTTAGTTAVYGQYITTTATNAADFGTVNQYGLYVANGTSSTNGTSTKYGVYIETPTGADTNYTIYSPNFNVTGAGVVNLGAAGSIMLPASELGTDHTWSGITETGTGGENIAIGDVVTLHTDGEWYLADANIAHDTAGDARRKCGLACTTSSDGAAITVLLWGKMRHDAFAVSLLVGDVVYIGEDAGAVVTTQPSTASAVIRIIGYGNTEDEIFFCPSPDWIVHT